MSCKNLQQKPATGKDKKHILVQQSGSCLNLTLNRHSNVHSVNVKLQVRVRVKLLYIKLFP